MEIDTDRLWHGSIRWRPVVLSFSFTSKELRADPWETLRESLEQLDIKYSSEYEPLTSHVVSKKRNTSKGLQALINGKYIVTDTFISAIVDAATPPADPEDGTLSPLERDYNGNWPNPIHHLPPRGEEPSDRPADAYAPNERRQEVFEGYTFVFYEQKQYDNLFPAITHGKGKALFKHATPGKTDVDDFVRYVKEVAGEKGMGSFDDGSEGKGVVVVRYVPAKGGDYEWFAQFLTTFAQRLDHRPIDQREFLEAILACDASMLRRPLQEDTGPSRQASRVPESTAPEPDTRMDIDEPEPQPQSAAPEPAEVQDIAPLPARTRARRGAPMRFKGFDLDSDDESKPEISQLVDGTPPEPAPEPAAASQGSLFVSQRQESAEPIDLDDDQTRTTRRPQRKRALSPLPDHDESAFLDGIAPTAAAAKRRRIESGQAPVAPEPAKEDEMVVDPPTPKKNAPAPRGRGKKAPTEADDILEAARQFRDQVDARAAAEKKALAIADAAEVDFAQVRANHVIEECAVHFPKDTQNSDNGDRDGGGRWDPRWNGRKNFKRFRKQGEAGGRAAPRIIVGLEEVKPKEYGIGDDYWLEDESSRRKESQRETQSQAQQPPVEVVDKARASALRRTVLAVDSSDEEEEEDTMGIVDPSPPLSRSKAGKSAEKESSRRSQLLHTQSQSQATTTSSSRASARGVKRPAPPEPVNARVAKKARAAPVRVEESAEDDSDDELKFRFGRRR